MISIDFRVNVRLEVEAKVSVKIRDEIILNSNVQPFKAEAYLCRYTRLALSLASASKGYASPRPSLLIRVTPLCSLLLPLHEKRTSLHFWFAERKMKCTQISMTNVYVLFARARAFIHISLSLCTLVIVMYVRMYIYMY